MVSENPGPVIRVLVATPLGERGRGGIDRIMDEVRHELAASPPEAMSVRFVTTRGPGSILLSPLHLMRAVLALFQRPDVLHINLSSHGSTLRKIVLAHAARLLGIPFVIHLHGSRFRAYWDGAPGVIARGIDGLFAHAAGIAVLGGVWRDFVAAKVPETASRIVILPNATRPPAPFERVPNEEPVILFLGRLGARKGVPDLVDALAALQRSAPDRRWRAIIAGDGDIEITKAAVEQQGLAARVDIPGWVGPAEVDALLRSADILVLPSFDENLPMSVIEGMAYGLAIVATPVGAVEDILHEGQTGLLVPPGDPPRLRAALEKLVTDEALRRSLGQAGARYHAQNLAIVPYARSLVALWRDVATSHSR